MKYQAKLSKNVTVLYCITDFAGASLKSYVMQLPVFLFLDVLHQQRKVEVPQRASHHVEKIEAFSNLANYG